MMRPFRGTALTVAALLFAAPLGAQYDQVTATPVSHCGGTRLTRTAIGGGVGAWLAFFAAKVRYSDWTDASRSSSAQSAKIQATVMGAIVGASVGNWGLPATCGPQVVATSTDRLPARNIINTADVAKFGQSGSVYDMVFALRKHWLNARGLELSEAPDMSTYGVVTPAAPTLIAYLDNARLGDMEQLRTLPVAGVVAVRYYDAAQATQRFGAGHRHGVIQVVTATEASEAAGPTGPITGEEIQQSRVQGTVYDLVLALRRSWLDRRDERSRGTGTDDASLPVYRNDARLGTLDALKTLPIAGVIGIRFYDGAEATFKWGLGHSNGAIQVLTQGH